MKLMVLVFCVVAQRFYQSSVLSDNFDPFERYLEWIVPLGKKIMHWNCWLFLAFVAAPIFLIIELTFGFLSSEMMLLGLPSFALSVVVLLFCLRTPGQAQQLAAYDDVLESGDIAAAAEAAKTIFHLDFPQEREQLVVAVNQALLLRNAQDVFAVILWYLLLGPFGAVVVRLLVVLEHRARNLGSRDMADPAARVLHIVMWPVCRLMGLSFAFVGHFSQVFAQCQHDFSSNDPVSVCLPRLVEAALGLPDFSAKSLTKHQQAMFDLLDHALIVWLAVVALVQVGGWLM
jgi:AmpE protein